MSLRIAQIVFHNPIDLAQQLGSNKFRKRTAQRNQFGGRQKCVADLLYLVPVPVEPSGNDWSCIRPLCGGAELTMNTIGSLITEKLTILGEDPTQDFFV